MKGNTGFSKVLTLVVLSLLLSACKSQLAADPEATSINPSATPSPIPASNTPEPTNTSTPTPEYPEEAGNIVETEMYEGKLYGIDDHGLATVVFNQITQKWEMYERPIFVAGESGGAYDEQISEMIENIDWEYYMQEMRKNRLRDIQGNPIPFGYLYETPAQGDNPGIAYLSGFVTDLYAREIAGAIGNFVAFVIPYRYKNQVIVFDWAEHSHIDNSAYVIEDNMILDSEIGERPDHLFPAPYTRAEIGKMLRSELQGKQVVMGIGVDWSHPSMEVRNIIYRMLIETIINEETFRYTQGSVPCQELWIPDLQE